MRPMIIHRNKTMTHRCSGPQFTVLSIIPALRAYLPYLRPKSYVQ